MSLALTIEIFDLPAADGARWFYTFPPDFAFASLAGRIATLTGAEGLDVQPGDAGSWLGFDWRGYRFSANDPFGEVWLYAEDQTAPESLLEDLVRALSA